jgi:hypothetical protein
MSESPSSTTSIPAESFAPRDRFPPRGSLVAQYRLDHRNPINHFLHVGVGWPMVAISIVLLPFRPLWSAALFASAYAIMFFGHFVFERNAPTIFKEPSTPFVIAFAVIRGLWDALIRLARPRRRG